MSAGPPPALKVFSAGHIGGVTPLSWADGLEISLPADLLAEPALAGLVADGGITHALPADWMPDTNRRISIVNQMRLQCAYTEAPASSRLPVSYRRLPARLRVMIASLIGRRQRRQQDKWARYPKFPIDLSADYAADLLDVATCKTGRGEPTPVVLTHDLDSSEGLRNYLKLFAPLEETAGARSTCFIVPCSWKLDHSQLEDLVGRGHELGIHGHDHSNRTPFADADERRLRLDAALPLINRYRCTGYRAPSLVRTAALLDDLASRYGYDSSIPTSGGLFPTPNNGCATARPFRINQLAELPLSMPRDGSLRFLGYSPDAIADLWIHCAKKIADSGGVVVLLTHCESHFSGNPAMLAAYRHFLDFITGNQRFKMRTAREVMADYESRFPACPGTP